MTKSIYLTSPDKHQGIGRPSSGRLSEDPGELSPYAGRAHDIYVFSIAPEGYEGELQPILRVPTASIDQEACPRRRNSSEEAFLRESAAFERLLPDLLRTRAGLFVAVKDGQVIDEDADEFALARRVEEHHRSEFVLIRGVSEDEIEDRLGSPKVEMP